MGLTPLLRDLGGSATLVFTLGHKSNIGFGWSLAKAVQEGLFIGYRCIVLYYFIKATCSQQ